MAERLPATTVDAVGGFLTASTGLDFSGTRGRWLRDFFTAAQDLHDDAWVNLLLDGDPDAFERLCDVATVQESYFFREPASLGVLREQVLPELASRPGPVRVWSAGCAGGEEAYTLALMLAEAGLSARSRVLGTDLARVAVTAARRGFFGTWSMRGVDKPTRDRCFTRSGKGFVVPSERRAPVRFEQHNLLSGEPPADAPFDAVLCRNVLIYLTPAAVAEVAGLLTASLRPGGVLVTGVADPPLAGVPGLVREPASSGTVYHRVVEEPLVERRAPAPQKEVRRPATSRPARRPAPPETVSSTSGNVPSEPVPARAVPSSAPASSWPQSAERALLMAAPREAERLARSALAATTDRRSAHAMLVRALAGDARIHEALAAAELAVSEYALDAELHGLHASVLLEAGRAAEARDAARRALYLDHDLALAHLVLARAAELLGDTRAAERARRTGHRLLTGSSTS